MGSKSCQEDSVTGLSKSSVVMMFWNGLPYWTKQAWAPCFHGHRAQGEMRVQARRVQEGTEVT